MQIKVDGMAELKKALKNKKVAVEKIATAVSKAGDKAESVAHQKVPKGTGNLDSSIHRTVVSGGKTVIIDADAKNSKGQSYAQYVEFGTKKHGKAQPFMRPAQEAGKQVLIEECTKLVKTQ